METAVPTLFFTTASPYARKARVVLAEKGLAEAVQMQACMPFERPADLVAANPLSKVPTLVLEDGTVLFDSPVICEYLDALASPRLIPESGPARWQALRRQAQADGLLDAGVLIRLEGLRPDAERSPGWVEQQWQTATRTLDAFEAEAADFGAAFGIGEITLACALAWLDFRMPERDWRDGRPALTAWERAVAARPSMAATRPQ